MEFRTEVRSGVRPPEVQFNADSVYIHTNIVKSEVPEEDGMPARTEYVYDEVLMPRAEYDNLLAGHLFGADAWTDALRMVERREKYRIADEMISKYTTDVADEKKTAEWVNYKAAVRATQSQKGYPESISYPEMPQ